MAVPPGGLRLVRRGLEVRTGDGGLVGTVRRRPVSRFRELQRSERGQVSVKDLMVTLDVSRPDRSAWFVFDKRRRAKEAAVTLADGTPIGLVRPHTGLKKLKAGGASRMSLIPRQGPELIASRPLMNMTFTLADQAAAEIGEVTSQTTPQGGVAGTGLGGDVELWDEMTLAPTIEEPVKTLCVAFLVGFHCFDGYKPGYPPRWG